MNEEFESRSKAMDREFNRIVGATLLAALVFSGLIWFAIHRAVKQFDPKQAAHEAGQVVGGIKQAFGDGLKESSNK